MAPEMFGPPKQMTPHEVANFVHGELVKHCAALNQAGVPLDILLGRLLKLAARMAIHGEGKSEAERHLQNFLDRYFAGITPEDERRIRAKAIAH
jgi:hypothetical protein